MRRQAESQFNSWPIDIHMTQTRTAQPLAVEVGAFQFSRIDVNSRLMHEPQHNAMLLNLGAVQHLLQEQSIYCAPPMVTADGVWLSVAGGKRRVPAQAESSRTLLTALHGLLDAFPVVVDAEDAFDRHCSLPVRALHARKASARRHLDKLSPDEFPSVASLHLSNGQLCAVNCGDARVWRLRTAASGPVDVKLLSRSAPASAARGGSVQALAPVPLFDGKSACAEPEVVKIDLRSSDNDWVYASYADVMEGDVYLLCMSGVHGSDAGVDLAQLWDTSESLHHNLHTLECVWRSWGAEEHISVVALRCLGAGELVDAPVGEPASLDPMPRLRALVQSSSDSVSISWIQRKLRVGYLHARELLEQLIHDGTLVRHWKEEEGESVFCASRPGEGPMHDQIWLRPQTWLNS